MNLDDTLRNQAITSDQQAPQELSVLTRQSDVLEDLQRSAADCLQTIASAAEEEPATSDLATRVWAYIKPFSNTALHLTSLAALVVAAVFGAAVFINIAFAVASALPIIGQMGVLAGCLGIGLGGLMLSGYLFPKVADESSAAGEPSAAEPATAREPATPEPEPVPVPVADDAV